jgi:hypothetical protein
MPLIATRIFPSEKNPLALVLELSEKLRFSEPCPLSPSDGLWAVYPSLGMKKVAAHCQTEFDHERNPGQDLRG